MTRKKKQPCPNSKKGVKNVDKNVQVTPKGPKKRNGMNVVVMAGNRGRKKKSMNAGTTQL